MAKIDNELLAEKGLGWERKGWYYGSESWLTPNGARHRLPNFAYDPEACFELIRRLPDNWDVVLFNNGNGWVCRISDPFTWCRGFGLDQSLESAIAIAFTALFKAELTRIGDG